MSVGLPLVPLLFHRPVGHQQGKVVGHLPDHSALGHSTSVHSAPAQAISKDTHIYFVDIYVFT